MQPVERWEISLQELLSFHFPGANFGHLHLTASKTIAFSKIVALISKTTFFFLQFSYLLYKNVFCLPLAPDSRGLLMLLNILQLLPWEPDTFCHLEEVDPLHQPEQACSQPHFRSTHLPPGNRIGPHLQYFLHNVDPVCQCHYTVRPLAFYNQLATFYNYYFCFIIYGLFSSSSLFSTEASKDIKCYITLVT